jgi:hypothetical protein
LVIPALRGARVLDLVEGKDEAPAEFTEEEDANKKRVSVVNPAYETWIARDQLVLRWLVNALSPDVLAHVVGIETSAEVWEALNDHVAASQRPEFNSFVLPSMTLARTISRLTNILPR